MITISLCMIVKNEEQCLRACLESVKGVVDEYIIVDTGSTDGTKAIIRDYCDMDYHFTWINDFSAARNYAFSLATKEYILWLDADDILLEKDRLALFKLKQNLSPTIDIVSMIYDITFNEKGECILSIPRDKLIRNGAGFYWRYFVHEELVVQGTRYDSLIHITHTSDHGHYSRYIPNYEKRIADGYSLLPHEKYFFGGELFMAKNYERCITILTDFLDDSYDNSYEIKRAYEYIIACYEIQEQYSNALEYAFRYMKQYVPSINMCYTIATLFYQMNQTDQAIYWYQTIIEDSLHPIINQEAYSKKISSLIQLCVCHYKKGNLAESIKYNDKVLELDSTNKSALYNQQFFQNL
ncbi:tetratricopeptide repeat-containing glycosyltransferase family 2 protein [Anaerosporobacter sp.]|uniref:tetratricopeptide repeat-containing glycosyltransferase family 2 protein n=1 Tax=Anaerosporobacter sp. TaxID=1872529 RepID=UPI00286EFD0B|nr:glycosyltransferase [Anaerosporobacter sp.]